MAEGSALHDSLLSRVEDAGINASAPPQQLWMDGWLLRFNPGKAKRARCINAVAQGRMPLADKLQQAHSAYLQAGLPMVVRITPFTQPPDLDHHLAAMGYTTLDDTRVMVCALAQSSDLLALSNHPPPLPDGLEWVPLPATAYAQAVGALRGSSLQQQEAHAHRLSLSPVPYHGLGIRDVASAQVLACGQSAREGDVVGLYDVFTHPQVRNQGLATILCKRLLSDSVSQGASYAYLQVEADNTAARSIYTHLGFRDGYAYHYRVPPGA